jgi:hypothetical protein
MTLRQWQDRHVDAFTMPHGAGGAGRRVFTDKLDSDARFELYHLKDYRVDATLSGPSLALAPKAKKR